MSQKQYEFMARNFHLVYISMLSDKENALVMHRTTGLCQILSHDCKLFNMADWLAL